MSVAVYIMAKILVEDPKLPILFVCSFVWGKSPAREQASLAPPDCHGHVL